MQYLSAYYWQQETCALTSLVLQQLVYRKGKIPVLFACICNGNTMGKGEDSSYFTEQLANWFWSRQQSLVQEIKKDADEKKPEEIEREICYKIMQVDREISLYERYGKRASEAFKGQVGHVGNMIGLLCIANRFWLFGRGSMEAYLLNTRFERVHCESLLGKEELKTGEIMVMSGLMEAEIGLLLATENFNNKLSKQELAECLRIKDVNTRERGKRRLEELGAAAECRGGRHMGAILLATK